MALPDLTTSTVRTEDYFSGVSPKDSTPQWSRDESIESGNQTHGIMTEALFFHLFPLAIRTCDVAKSQLWMGPVTNLEREAIVSELFRSFEIEAEEDDDLLIDERIDTKPNAVYRAKIRIRGIQRAKPMFPIGYDPEMDLLDE
jgi:hypothetical protein